MLFAGQHDKVGVGRTTAPPEQPVGGGLKRALDIVVALTALLLLAPLLAAVALLVLAGMGRPVLARHTRIGFGGRAIGCFRFRTTETLSPGSPLTPLGAMLVRSGIAELPQLLNVVRGEMSCVGPRPLTAEELRRYASEAGPYLRARPGLTGAWQLGPHAPDRGEAAAIDGAYVRNWSMRGDLRILLRTIPGIER
jgi:exopolysaccharide production protein ExoY